MTIKDKNQTDKDGLNIHIDNHSSVNTTSSTTNNNIKLYVTITISITIIAIASVFYFVNNQSDSTPKPLFKPEIMKSK